ncbi:hypothetical protein EVG20_g4960 [Dentipellis fragilis]|uniref:Tyr recombinase domain-containing protein n=1 Tax=Dentipellis fragilis TaxID=205917 RepID=A0A4Y9YWK8_9AGAM|nr:hypothetical protein EVG20_g4960 [Dentipellis fragilis]
MAWRMRAARDDVAAGVRREHGVRRQHEVAGREGAERWRGERQTEAAAGVSERAGERTAGDGWSRREETEGRAGTRAAWGMQGDETVTWRAPTIGAQTVMHGMPPRRLVVALRCPSLPFVAPVAPVAHRRFCRAPCPLSGAPHHLISAHPISTTGAQHALIVSSASSSSSAHPRASQMCPAHHRCLPCMPRVPSSPSSYPSPSRCLRCLRTVIGAFRSPPSYLPAHPLRSAIGNPRRACCMPVCPGAFLSSPSAPIALTLCPDTRDPSMLVVVSAPVRTNVPWSPTVHASVLATIHWAASRDHVSVPQRLVIYCDNTNTVDLFSSLHAQPQYNPLLRSAVDTLIRSNIDLRVLHIPGENNGVADALSRWDIDRALRLFPDLRISHFTPPPDALGAERWSRERLLHERAVALGFALKDSSLLSYSSALQSYLAFCETHQLPVEPTEETLSFYVVYTCHYIRPTSVRNYLSGICQQLEAFFPQVRTVRRSKLVSQTLAGCFRTRAHATTRKSPLTRAQLVQAITSYQHSSSLDDLLFCALMTTAFHGLLRLGELVLNDNPRLRDYRTLIERTSVKLLPNGYRFLLPSSKTDRVFHGAEIIIAGLTSDDDALVPFTSYLRMRDQLFPFHPHLWLCRSGQSPTRSWFMRRLRSHFPADISGHSLRAGGATALAEEGVPLDYIQHAIARALYLGAQTISLEIESSVSLPTSTACPPLFPTRPSGTTKTLKTAGRDAHGSTATWPAKGPLYCPYRTRYRHHNRHTYRNLKTEHVFASRVLCFRLPATIPLSQSFARSSSIPPDPSTGRWPIANSATRNVPAKDLKAMHEQATAKSNRRRDVYPSDPPIRGDSEMANFWRKFNNIQSQKPVTAIDYMLHMFSHSFASQNMMILVNPHPRTSDAPLLQLVGKMLTVNRDDIAKPYRGVAEAVSSAMRGSHFALQDP